MTQRTPHPDDPPTRFHDLTDKMLADEFGAIDEELDIVTERQDEARLEMTRRGKWAIEGHVFTVLKAEGNTTSLDTTAVRTEMGTAWYAARCKAGKRTTYRINRMGGDAAPPPPPPKPKPKPRARKAAAAKPVHA